MLIVLFVEAVNDELVPFALLKKDLRRNLEINKKSMNIHQPFRFIGNLLSFVVDPFEI